MPAIVVLVKSVPDTWSTANLEADHTLDRDNVDNVIDEVNEYAVEQALRLRDNNSELGLSVIALTMGPAGAEEALRRAIAMGADDAVHVVDDALAGSDVLGTAWTLTNALNTIPDVQLIVAGASSSDGSTGALAGVLAEYRQIPALNGVRKVSIDSGVVHAVREDHEGLWELEAELPAIVSVTDKADKPRFPNFKGLRAAKKHPITTLSISDIGVTAQQVGLGHAATAVVDVQKRPARTKGVSVQQAQGAEAVAQLLSNEQVIGG